MRKKVVLFDLWMTLVYGLSTDPVLTLQGILNHRKPGEPLDSEFLTKCLTTNIRKPGAFVRDVAGAFGLQPPAGAVTAFRRLIEAERKAATKYDDTDEVLLELRTRGGYRLGLISNLWPFPVHRIFNEMKLGRNFEHLVYSFAVGARKPDSPIFEHAVQLFDVKPEECVMVGDSRVSDVEGALNAGLDAILLDPKVEQASRQSKRLHVAPSLTAVKLILS